MSERKSVLCFLPLPPPVTGAAAASLSVVEYLGEKHELCVFQYQRGNLISGKFSARQLLRILKIGAQLLSFKGRRKAFDAVYLVISSTLWGNLRDLFLMFILGKVLRTRTVVHLHGANIDRYLQRAPGWLKRLNRAYFGEVKSAVVLGETFLRIFDGYVPQSKVEVVKNYFDPYLLIPEEKLRAKFATAEKVNILYLSNLIPEKGYARLLDAFLALPAEVQEKAVLNFVGEIKHPQDREIFMKKIAGNKNIVFHGPLSGEAKKQAFWDAHVFCLPTYYVFEGQPISILEAYAAGCVTLTTPNGGILDIFEEGKNGYTVSDGLESNQDLFRDTLAKLIAELPAHAEMALLNRREAESKYQKELYCSKMESLLVGR